MKFIYSIILLVILIPFHGTAQEKDNVKTLNDTLTQVAREIILSSRTCTLITLDANGRSSARIMDTLKPDSDFTIWFGTNPKSRKVGHIKNDSRVTLLYKDHDNSGYVTLYGKAEIVSDPLEKEKKWKEEWAAFYKNRQNDFVLIKVSPEWMEIVSNTRGVMGDPITWEPQKVWLDKTKL